VYSFGDGRWGKLGNGTTSDERYPTKVGFDLATVKVEQIAAGEDHSVILTRAHSLSSLLDDVRACARASRSHSHAR
jgi:alpha-tubulin suppressor-like RCC1 family protein